MTPKSTQPYLPARSSLVYYCVGDGELGIYGHLWRLWASRTSFYIKPRMTALSALKISLHGPDTRDGIGPPHFKMHLDQGARPAAEAAEGSVITDFPPKGYEFTGRPAESGARHVITIRSTWDLFQPGVPSGPVLDKIVAGAVGVIAPAPREFLTATDLDLYVSDGAPYWRNEAQARADNACLPALRNDADQYLTGVVVRRSSLDPIPPANARAPSPLRPADRVRGIGASEGVLWVVEQWMDRSIFTRANKDA